ncbi:NAD(P)H-dependent oxidoreductase [uncultured Parasphingopyxis sp.]|uniref:NAD(P)H-dependent oxidoreductase n=1 Tax=uncultured Parasphingopyxis sp. TaxID=1547918 RepID=UPI00345B7CB1
MHAPFDKIGRSAVGWGHRHRRSAIATLLIVYHSRTGGTEQMAKAAAEAARDADGADVVLKRAEDAGPDDLLAADGYLFATPENLAAIAGVMKAFFDRSYYEVLGKIEGRPYAAMICAGSDGENARTQLERIATGWRLKKIADTPIICTHAQTKEAILAKKQIPEDSLALCREIGATLAAGLEMGVF